MKTAVAVALIICGTLLLLAPAVYDYLLVLNVSETLRARSDFNSISSGEPMSPLYRFVCWATGAGMILISVVQSIWYARHVPPNGPAVR